MSMSTHFLLINYSIVFYLLFIKSESVKKYKLVRFPDTPPSVL